MKPETQTQSEGELRWLAEQATPGPWYSIHHGVSTEQDIPGNRAKENICGVACTRGKYEPEERNRDYIAAANPQTMIALLDKLTTATERAERLEQLLRELHTLVWGECSSLLNEDSGGDAGLDIDIRLAINPEKGG